MRLPWQIQDTGGNGVLMCSLRGLLFRIDEGVLDGGLGTGMEPCPLCDINSSGRFIECII